MNTPELSYPRAPQIKANPVEAEEYIASLVKDLEGARAALKEIIAFAPSQKPKDNSGVDAGGYWRFSEDPDDHFYLGIEHGRWASAEIARAALTGVQGAAK